MKLLPLPRWLVLAFLVLGPAAFAQTGAIEGRVQNAVTGDRLNNARVSVPGTNLVALTGEDGTFRLADVPAGAAALRVFFTGLDEKEVTVHVAPGRTVQQDVALTSRSRYGDRGETVQLDRFLVESTKETNAAAIAVNEQRFAANQKSVVSADQFGIIPDSNPGELVKWLPGVSVEYFANTIVGVSVRGLDSANTEINFDGMPVASTTSTNSNNGRGFEMRAASASDVARVEVRKLPLPENSSNSLGGSINFVRRSAFEYSRRRIDYNAFFTSDAQSFTLKERDGPKDRKLQWWRPNLQLKWTEPLSKTLGFAVTLGHDDKITDVHWSFPTWNFGSAAQAAGAESLRAAGQPLSTLSVYNPVKTTDGLHQNPVWNYKDYATMKVDWKPRPELRLSYSINANLFRNQTADDVRFTWNTGAFPTTVYSATNPQPALGAPGTMDEHAIYGAVGNGSILFDTREGWRDEYNPTLTNGLEAEWRRDAWTFSARASFSATRHILKDRDDGFFNNMTSLNNTLPNTGLGAGSANPRRITVNLLDETKYIAQRVEARDAVTGAPIDWQNPANMNIAGATSRQGKAKETIGAVRLFAKRSFNLAGNPLSLQLGFDFDDQYRNHGLYENNLWRFVGADHVAQTADDNAAQIASVNIKPVRDHIYNAPEVPRLSMTRLYKLYQEHPDWFTFLGADSYRTTIANAWQIDERTKGLYLQAMGTLFHNRLSYAGGVRYERADATGRGLLDRGARSVPAGVDPTSLEGLQARYVREGARGKGTNDGYFPSLHLNYELRPNLLFRIGYAKTQAKNRFDRTVIPSTTINEGTVTSDPFAGAKGTINIRNANLRPWIGHNYETHLEYYTPQGGVLGIGAFRKNIHNWQTNAFSLIENADDAARWGVDPTYVGYRTSSIFNDGNGRLDGVEAEMRQPLDGLAPERMRPWLRGFSLTGSFNYNDLKKRPGTNISTDFSTLYQTQTKAALGYNRGKISSTIGIVNYGKVYRQRDDAAGHTGYRYYPPFNQIDFNFQFRATKWASLFLSGVNLTGARKLRERAVDGAPAWSRMQIENNLGRTITAGVTGSF